MALRSCPKCFELHRDNLGPDSDLKECNLVKRIDSYKIIIGMKVMSAIGEVELKFSGKLKKIKMPFL